MLARNALEESYLKHILIAVEARDCSAPFRTFFDSWFAFKSGGPFLNSSSRPHWFNNPCPSRHGEALRRAHFVSMAAARTLAHLEPNRLVKDHAIPVAVLRDMLFDEQPGSIEEVRLMMQRKYRIGILIHEEDDMLSKSGLRSKMPVGWVKSDSPFARYEQVGIVAQDVGLCGNAIRVPVKRAHGNAIPSTLQRGFRAIGSGRFGKSLDNG